MRWSLILSAFFAVQSALSFVCFALAIPPSPDRLERRAPQAGPRIAHEKYRENAKSHPFAYHVTGLDPNGKIISPDPRKTPPNQPVTPTKVTQEKLGKGKKYEYGHKRLTEGVKLHADHVYEIQMFQKHLNNKGMNFNHLSEKLQHKVTGILNSPKNMAIIPASINQSKGQLIKHGMAGNQIVRKGARDEYARLSYNTAHRTAKRLDKVFKKHGPANFGDHGFRDILKTTFVNAGLHAPGHGSPASSRHSSPASSRSSSRSRSHSHSNQGPSRPSTPGPSRHSNPGSPLSSPNYGRQSNRS
jgi:hypothetical protein